jgi:hypothetical protein
LSKKRQSWRKTRERGWFNPSLVAMVFAFHTVEAHLNYVGEKLAPDLWKDERNFFRKEPYRGFDGKLRKVMELVGLAWPEPVERPLKTILELKNLRDRIAHGKSEKLTGEVLHENEADSTSPISTLRSLVTPKEKLAPVLPDVEDFLNHIQTLAAPMVKGDVWFRSEALRGPKTYSVGATNLE